MYRPLKVLVPLVSALVITSVFSLAVLADDAGWKNDDGTWYYYDDSGEMAKGWLKINEKWYYFNQSGEMVTGWQLIGGDWYYLYSSGEMATNTTIDGFRINSGGAAEKLKGSYDSFDWELSPVGEFAIYCKKDTIKVGDVFDEKIIEKATSLKIMKSDDSQYENMKIDKEAFVYFYYIRTVDISAPVTSIGKSAFDHCTSL